MPKKKCGNCGAEWQIVWLCPICQARIIKQNEETGKWRCLACGEELLLSVDTEGHLRSFICPRCKTIYIFDAMLSI